MEVKESYISVVNAADRTWEDSLVECCNEGELILAYKNPDIDLLNSEKEVLYQVIVKRSYTPSKRRYMVSVLTSLRSYTLNMLPKEYLLEELVSELESFEVGGKILANFKQIIEDIEE